MSRALEELTALRHELHRLAERSDQERATAACIQDFLSRACVPDTVVTDLGGCGVAAVYHGEAAGPTVLLRAELDALPIPETRRLDYASQSAGVAHKCGHDGHMAILAGAAAALGQQRPARGRVVLLFQPAEETGAGAARVLADDHFITLAPDMVFALHNLPGYPLGAIVTRAGVFASASQGFVAGFQGRTSHAAEPQHGHTPAPAIAQMITGLHSIAQLHTALHEAAQVTVIHANVGEEAFGTSPGDGKVMATLRAHTDDVMATLRRECQRLAESVASTFHLEHRVHWVESFPRTLNDARCSQRIARVAQQFGLPVIEPTAPFAWSEDFGHFTAAFPGALFGIGAGEDGPALHHPQYDFPDELIDVGISVFMELITQSLEDGVAERPSG